jgi:hypothetical protein
MDLRTKDGRSFRKHFSKLCETYPAATEFELKTLASLKVQIERAQADTFHGGGFWERSRSRESMLEMVRLARRLERDLAVTKPPPVSEPAAPALAQILARHTTREAAE